MAVHTREGEKTHLEFGGTNEKTERLNETLTSRIWLHARGGKRLRLSTTEHGVEGKRRNLKTVAASLGSENHNGLGEKEND